MTLFTTELARVLTLSRADRLAYLERLHPSDAEAVVIIMDDCLRYRWPKTHAEWYAVAEHLSEKH